MPCPRKAVQSLKGHTGPVHVVSYSRGAASYCLSGGQDRSIRLWNPKTGAEIKRYIAHGYEVLSISCAHDNAKLVSGGGDKSVFYWDVATGQTIRRIPGHAARINAVSFNEDASVVASGSFDATVKIWDLKWLRAQARSPIQSLEESRDAIQTLYVGPQEIITGSVDGHVRTYDLRKGQLTSDYMGHPITSIVPTKDQQTLLVTTLDAKIRLLDRKTGQVLNTFSGHKHDSYRCRAVFDVKEECVIFGDEEGRIWAWDLVTAAPLPPDPERVHEKAILWTEYHPLNDALLTASSDGMISLWEM
ncbi:related to WD40-repeat protein (notchless protein) [Serendipita indica DSM 11827]|uniref:Related to WD40-repeat protein (Notchless protein) n=1 Tax=Serendipita indica (strain DSM 11827) TaxID=1109443 RepID=G4TAF4_SERID|nr:related to WD40-repeat protein (notchless protein) [Serendipita indica DSM 11827]